MVSDWIRRIKHRMRVARAIKEIEKREIIPDAHGLDAPVVVSLTSYPARFSTLALTLRALLCQTVKPDQTILWLANDDDSQLPPDVLSLQDQGLTIRSKCSEVRSYTKIVPALASFPNAYIVTADDDVYYRANWLADLVALARPGRVVAHRAHLIQRTATGLSPYDEWRKNISDPREDADVFATGVGGVLYPPHSLHADATREELFMQLCPTADDVWFWWMARLAGSTVRHIGPKVRVIEWPSSQTTSLRSENLGAQAGNDHAIAAMIEYYGLP